MTRFELAVGVAIFGLLAAGAGWVFSGDDAEEQARAERSATRILEAAERWQRDHEVGCPTLSVLHEEQVLSGEVTGDDPWGSRFRVRCAPDQLTVWSPGRDGAPATADDIAVSRG